MHNQSIASSRYMDGNKHAKQAGEKKEEVEPKVCVRVCDMDFKLGMVSQIREMGGGGGGGNAILGYFRPYLSRAIFGFSRCTWTKIALKLKQVNICSSN